MSDFVIEAIGVSHRYGPVNALDGLSLRVTKGSVYALLGVNGSGKTTLVKLLTGQTRLQSGQIRLFGQNADERAFAAIHARTGYVPENKNLYANMTAAQCIEFLAGFYKGHRSQAANRCIELFEIPLHRRIGDFSKGMKSQLALSLALLGDPELLILDEPTDGLDAVRRNQFFNIVLDMVAEEEKAVFLTTNTIADVEKIADHTGLIRGGKLCLDGETGSLVENSRKVRVAFAEGYMPDLEHWPGVRRVERENRSYLLHIGSNAEEILERLKALPTVFLDVFRMSLEDIFLDINGGRD